MTVIGAWYRAVMGTRSTSAGRSPHYLLQLVQLCCHEESFFVGTAEVLPKQFGFGLLDVGR
ncbi:MAG: hypothetical protein JST42_08895 [Bacteroidetes bacterium]|nr:hypothetical protein [Bacteroidota bacterium]